jgi:hypothetical protein
MLRKTSVLVLLSLVLFTSYLPLAAFSTANLLPAQGACPTYLTNLTVDLVNSSPISITTGDVVTTTFHVVYPDGTPVQLTPETASFLWTGAAGQKEFYNVNVTYTGNPGYYNYTEAVTADITQATLGSATTGKIYVQVAVCSLSDALGNRGPTGDIGSGETLTPSDNSNLNAGPPPSTVQPLTYVIPIIIAILVIIALLLFLRRSKKGKKGK